MNFKSYLPYAKSNPLLKDTLDNRSERYLPFFRLGERLKQRVKEVIIEKGDSADKLSNYIPFLDGGPDGVTDDQTKNLRGFLQDNNGGWPYEKDDPEKILQTFWYCYSNHKSPGTHKDQSFVKLNILNIISKFVGFTDFDDFVRVEFSNSRQLTLLMVPLHPHDEIFMRVLNEIWWNVQNGFETKNNNVKVMFAVDRSIRALEYLTSEHAREIGHRNKADLVIWGRPLFSNKFKLNCHAVNPVWEMHHGSWSLDFHLEEVEEESSAVNIQLKHTCYWCLFNRSFFGREYQQCYDYLIKALELGVESFEIQMRAAVIKDIVDDTTFAKQLYLKMLSLLGIEDAQEQLEKLLDPVRIADQANSEAGFNFGDFVKRDDIRLDGSVSEAQKSMFFEMVRIKLFFLFKDKFDAETYERVLTKITTHARSEWLDREYWNLLAWAHFDMGKLLHHKFLKNSFHDIDKCYDQFEHAILLSNEEPIHLECLRYLKDTKRLEGLEPRIKKEHHLNKKILQLYGW